MMQAARQDDPSRDDAGNDKGRRQRTRTGCLTCRKRRRKCDEAKPQCFNCTEKGFDCVYGTQLSFLTSNAKSIDPVSHIAPAKRRWDEVEFIQWPAVSGHGRVLAPQNATPPRRPSPAALRRGESGTRPPVEAGPDPLPHSDENQVRSQHKRSVTSHSNSTINHSFMQDDDPAYSPASNEHDEIRFPRGLGGGRPNTRMEQTEPTGTHVDNSTQFELAPLLDYGDMVLQPNRPFAAEDMAKDIQRMSYYRYHVAPWLDMIDERSLFGLVPPLLSKISPGIRHSLFAVASLHMGLLSHRRFDLDHANSLLSLANSPQCALELESPMRMLPLLFQAVCLLLSVPPQDWAAALAPGWPQLNGLVAYAWAEDLAGSMFWCCLRLDIAQAMASHTSCALPVKAQILSYYGMQGFSMEVGKTPRTSFQSLSLLAVQVLDLTQSNHSELPRRDAGNSTEQWLLVWRSLEDWHNTATAEMQPLFECASFHVDQDFPVIVFASGLARIATQLFHALALEMLACQPRTVKLGPHSEIATSALFHARMVCAIASSNRDVVAWDPTMIPMLEKAAYRMTHKAQQDPIIETLRWVQSKLGWRVQGVIDGLASTWASSES